MAMTRAGRAVILAVVVIIGIAAAIFNENYKKQLIEDRATNGKESPALIGQQRPDFSLHDIDGFPRKVSEWDGGIMVLNFWASWCKPCRREMPSFVSLQEKYGPQGLQFIGIALDGREAVQGFLTDLGLEINYPMLIGEDDGIDIAKAYGNAFGILPYTVFVDRNGLIVHLQYGEMTEEFAENLISQQL